MMNVQQKFHGAKIDRMAHQANYFFVKCVITTFSNKNKQQKFVVYTI